MLPSVKGVQLAANFNPSEVGRSTAVAVGVTFNC